MKYHHRRVNIHASNVVDAVLRDEEDQGYYLQQINALTTYEWIFVFACNTNFEEPKS